MTVSITIRDLPNETRDALAARAAKSGRSLQEYLSAQLRELAAKPDIDTALAEIRSRARSYRSLASKDILSDLDADRR
jgi:antitoxin FitA